MAYDIIFSGLVSAIVSVIINIVIYWLNKKRYENEKKLKEINNQLLDVYLPMERAIEDYAKAIVGKPVNPNPEEPQLITLDSKLRDIKQKNTRTFDAQVMNCLYAFFTSPSQGTLDRPSQNP